MEKLTVILPLQNESSNAVKIVLEPLAHCFTIQSGEKVEVHGICDVHTNNKNFTIAPNDNFLTIYAPGEISGFISCHIMKDGVRVLPEVE